MMDTAHFVLVFAYLEEGHLAQIRAVDPGVEVVAVTDRQKGIELADRAEIMVGWSVPREAIQRAGRLRWIHSTAAGVDQLLYREVLEQDIQVTTSSGIHQPLVEHVFAMLLTFTRRLHIAVRNQQEHKWDRARVAGGAVRGMTIGVLGLGSIGAEVAEKAAVFGMRVIGTKRTPSPVQHVDRVYPPEALADVLAQSDVVVIALPLTAETRGLLGAAEFRMMKPEAIVINIGRGPIIQEAALIRALQERWIGGACLDVFEREPLPADSPLWAMENVILTPHVSGAWPGYLDAAVPLFCENLARYLRGAPLLNLVERSRGY
ncbi:MAG TPA: D-2-hydroxyacid dehydrogenase [bacterium]